jgi:BRCT domain type II-containing protein
MLQLKKTAQKREDGKGNADNVGNKGGTKTSSLAATSALSPAVSALGQSSSSKPRQQHTQEIRNSQKPSASTTEGVTSKWHGTRSPARGTKNYKLPLPHETETMSTHSSSSLSVSKELELTLGEDTEEISATSLMKCDSVEGVLGQSKIYTTGTFNINRHEVDEEIKQGGGQVTSNIKTADLIVVGNNPGEREMEYLKGRSIPQIDLELLYKVLQAEIPLSSIMDTPGKVPFASSTIGIQRGDSSSSKSVSKYGFPRRIPKGRIDKVGDREGASRSSLAAASAIGHKSLLKPMIQGEGGTKANSRNGDQATDIIDGKGRIDKVGDREGTSRSLLAAASALGYNSLSKPMSQGEGGTKASSREIKQLILLTEVLVDHHLPVNP